MYGGRIRSLLAAFASETRANVAMIFALSVIPLMSMVGAGIDYSRAVAAKDRLNGIADSAVLQGVSNSAVRTAWSIADYGQAATKSLFVTQATTIRDLSLGAIDVTIQQTSNSRTVTLQYTATLKNYFTAFLHVPTTTLSGKVTSTVPMPVYMDFYLLLDNSPSMGLGATPADIKKLESNTPDQCSFACHQADKPGTDYYALAKRIGVTTRMDVVRQATQNLIDTASRTQAVTNQFRVGIFAFSNVLQTISPTTSDLAAAKTAANALDIITVPYWGSNADRYTDFDGMIPYTNYIPSGGTGTSSASPKSVVFLVTDAVADEPTPGNPGGRTIKPIPLALCDQMKSRNIQIAALYTTYYPQPNNSWYMSQIAPFASNIGPTMQQCASPGLYFEVSPSQGISEAMEALFKKAVGQARLTL